MVSPNLASPVAKLPRVRPLVAKRLKNLGVETVRDLLLHLPRRYDDFSNVTQIRNLQVGETTSVKGEVAWVKSQRTWRKRMVITEAVIADKTGSVRAVWFNQPYLADSLRQGYLVAVSGKVSLDQRGLVFSHPSHEVLRGTRSEKGESETLHTGRLVPVYPETAGLTSRWLRFLIQPLVKSVGDLPDPLPAETLRRHKLPFFGEALQQAHFPTNLETAKEGRRRLAFEELLLIQLAHQKARRKVKTLAAPAITLNLETVKAFVAALPFALTNAQRKAAWEILQDITKPHPMARLLEGDVGSGKTAVAAIAANAAAHAGYQTAFMAPTEILARQHFYTLNKLFAHTPHSVGLLTNSEARIARGGTEETMPKRRLVASVEAELIDVLVGTHALLQKNVSIPKLAFVVVDEQHRFGVEQRAALMRNHEPEIKKLGEANEIKIQNSKFKIPHLLSMSATPIPRTLALTIYGDLDLSILNELPKGRRAIETRLLPPVERKRAYKFVRDQVRLGRQAFVICPRIDPQSADERGSVMRESAFHQRQSALALWEVKAVTDEYQKLSKTIFPDLRVGMLHGKLPAKEKAKTMTQFANGNLDILVSTSVVEVGVDIPNATVMMIEGAEHFGLAQLYQFRGRVGRAEHQSYCLLCTDSTARAAHERLKAIVEAKSGFELAEKDLQLRGPGDFLGTRQSGLPDLAMASLSDGRLIKAARTEAELLLQQNADLSRWPLLKQRLTEFENEAHLE
ncbi:ATP-dependent DNA helicase RecG [Candidatus Parcubacteria bacterium]|nr:ATP-dependent DNA helicase RecG [Candidatus Parcubacteria bacterium]